MAPCLGRGCFCGLPLLWSQDPLPATTGEPAALYLNYYRSYNLPTRAYTLQHAYTYTHSEREIWYKILPRRGWTPEEIPASTSRYYYENKYMRNHGKSQKQSCHEETQVRWNKGKGSVATTKELTSSIFMSYTVFLWTIQKSHTGE